LKIALFEYLLPNALLHALYHLVRDMHYAAGIARAQHSLPDNP